MDYFHDTGWWVDVEKDLALQRQLLDVLIIETGTEAALKPRHFHPTPQNNRTGLSGRLFGFNQMDFVGNAGDERFQEAGNRNRPTLLYRLAERHH